MNWQSTQESLPAVGEDVVVVDCLDGEHFYAVARIVQDRDGSQYWDSSDDYFHGTLPRLPGHWAKLDPPPLPD